MWVYLAAPWFTPKQKDSMDKVREVLLRKDVKVFSPYYDGTVLDKNNDSPEMRTKVFNINIGSIDKCDFVVAIIDDFDPGTIFEIGYACKGKIPIICYSDVPGRGLNLMLQQASIGFSNGEKQLAIQIDHFLNRELLENFLTFKKGDVI